MNPAPESPPLHDISGRAEIELLVNRFYEGVREDKTLGFIFDSVAEVNWDTHLPKMYAFWETVLFKTGGYRGNPLRAHAKLVPKTEMGRQQFDRWLELFKQTVDTSCRPERRSHQKLRRRHGQRHLFENQRRRGPTF